jgi:hypothetical protein
MDNRINEIRRKISVLRSEMTSAEATVRDQVNRGVDCTERALHLIGLRKEMTRLIGEWKAVGGGDRLPNNREQTGSRSVKKAEKLARAGSRR